ncbi:ABC transporter permease [Mycoplasmopsis alligatoris]|uniref:ABC transporter, permease protein n=1 Tax=Mycoplasmopsis alligatoris A21JP2 TaxID=747682 RepID=D4XW38_9BACT|nr:ABC transporter permease [Mycoplasmopsis alligatoris]EFF41454.1 ABC transporter, permease protein [Mycoplasmopsis alligatoris A21JP2]
MFSKIKERLANNKRLTLLSPYLAVALLLIILPILLIIFNAFAPLKSENGYSDNWELLKAISTWNIISRSLRVGVISAILCLFIGFPYAYFVSSSKSKIFQIYAMSLMLSPMAIFTIARVYSLRTLFVNIFDDSTLNQEWFLVLGLTYLNLPLMIMPIYTVLKDMPKNIIEASHDLGYGSSKTMIKVIVPYALKAILSGFGMIFLSSATTFIISAKLLPDGSQNQMIGDIITKTINPGNKFDLSKGSSLVIVVSTIFIGIYSLILLLPKLFFKFKKGASYE